jgi:hypothetical protein
VSPAGADSAPQPQVPRTTGPDATPARDAPGAAAWPRRAAATWPARTEGTRRGRCLPCPGLVYKPGCGFPRLHRQSRAPGEEARRSIRSCAGIYVCITRGVFNFGIYTSDNLPEKEEREEKQGGVRKPRRIHGAVGGGGNDDDEQQGGGGWADAVHGVGAQDADA